MGWDYLKGTDSKSKMWVEVTRDERFFCQHLYHLIHRCPNTKSFVRILDELVPSLELDTQTEWEIGYEVCFYRDLWFLRGKNELLHSPKRTFDLCLFSAETIVIIEAKAQQGFDSDSSQKVSFKEDKTRVKDELEKYGVKQVKLLGLASSEYLVEVKKTAILSAADVVFDGLISWKQLAERFGDDEILKRANEIYDQPRGGANNEKHMTLGQIRQKIGSGEVFYIGCGGGFEKFKLTLQNDPLRRYETSMELVSNSNWFTSDEVKCLLQLGISPA